jgi:hypothetical protein
MEVEYSLLFLTILKMAVIIGIGAFLGRFVPFGGESRKLLVAIIINIALPSLILNGFLFIEFDRAIMMQMIQVFLFSVLFSSLGMLLALQFSKRSKIHAPKAKEIAFASALGNTGLIGIPLCASLFGAKGAVLAALFDAGMGLTLWTLGVIILQSNKKFSWKQLKNVVNAPLLATLAGIAIIPSPAKPPEFAQQLIGSLGAVASPLAMLYLGLIVMNMMKNKIRVSLAQIAMPILLKLIVFPFLAIVCLIFLYFQDDVNYVVMIMTAMPTLTTASIVMAMYHADEEFGALSSMGSILLSLVTVPLMVTVGSLFI